MSSKNEWGSYYGFIDKYIGEEYETIEDFGVHEVNVKDIISYQPSKFKEENFTLQTNEQESMINYASDICLLRSPNGKYIFNSGNIKKLLLIKKLGIKSVKVSIKIAIPRKYFTQLELEEMKNKKEALLIEDKKGKLLANRVQQLPLKKHLNYANGESIKEYIKWENCCRKRIQMKNELNFFFIEIAEREGLIPVIKEKRV